MYYILARYRRWAERPPESGGELPILFQKLAHHTEILPTVGRNVFSGGASGGAACFKRWGGGTRA